MECFYQWTAESLFDQLDARILVGFLFWEAVASFSKVIFFAVFFQICGAVAGLSFISLSEIVQDKQILFSDPFFPLTSAFSAHVRQHESFTMEYVLKVKDKAIIKGRAFSKITLIYQMCL